MSTPDLLMLIGMFVGGAVVLVVLLLAGIVAVVKLGDVLAGLPRVRQALVAEGMHPHLADQIVVELQQGTGGVGFGALLLLGGVAALGYGLYTLSGMYEPETTELLLYPAPGGLAIALGLWMFVSGRRVDRDASPLHRAIVTRAASARILVPTTKLLNIDVSTATDRLARTQVTQWQPIPHVLVVFDDGSEHMVRAFDDRDVVASSLLRCLHAQLPHARVETFVPSWDRAVSSQPQPRVA